MLKKSRLEGLSFFQLKENYPIKPFDCEDEDLNDFLFKEAIPYQKQMFVTTFLLFSLPPAPTPPTSPVRLAPPIAPTTSYFPTTLALALC